MIGLDKKAEILMQYFRENKSQRAISRDLKMSRSTVAKYIVDSQIKQVKFLAL